ncbi:MAG TPA: amidase [Polyangiaceae bacterium]|nr:amidase [Polyangiaceae bacterium]
MTEKARVIGSGPKRHASPLAARELAALDATAQAELVRRGEASAAELVDAAIARAERVNPSLNAIIHPLYEKARSAARDQLPAGPFHGVPFLVKDLLCAMKGDPYHLGTRFLKDAKLTAGHDAFLTRKLRAAGLVIMGRTNTPELGTLPTTEPAAYGPTRNPWDTTRSAGGSSGGSAAAVAAGIVAAAHGNDAGGSIRIPASACGLVGLKPSRGRISFGPDSGETTSGLASEGVLTRSVRDTAALLDAISGRMPGDPYAAPPPSRPFADEIGSAPGRLRIGVLTTAPRREQPVDAECVAGAEHTARLLSDLGHDVDHAFPAALDETEIAQHITILYATQATRTRSRLGSLCGRALTRDDLDELNWLLAELGRHCSAEQYINTIDATHAWSRRLAKWWSQGFDLLLTPTLPRPPVPLGYFATSPDPTQTGHRASQFGCFTWPFNLSGQPAISLPMHTSETGLPIGIQLIADYGREDLLLRVASQLEAAAPWSARRPRVHALSPT